MAKFSRKMFKMLENMMKPTDENSEYNESVKFKAISEVEYAITISPDPKLYISKTAKAQHEMMIPDIMREYGKYCRELILYAELTHAGNIHYHGFVTFKDHLEWKNRRAFRNRNIGNDKVKPIADRDGWLEYCLKEQDDMLKILQCNMPFLLTEYLDAVEIKKEIKAVERECKKESNNILYFIKNHKKNVAKRDKLKAIIQYDDESD